jgi:hypothetical protein
VPPKSGFNQHEHNGHRDPHPEPRDGRLHHSADPIRRLYASASSLNRCPSSDTEPAVGSRRPTIMLIDGDQRRIALREIARFKHVANTRR